METPIFNGMTDRWKRAIASTIETDSVVVFSPFLTGRIDKLLTMGKAAKRSVYTRFDVETFVSGASTISALRRLIEANVEVFKLDVLHAKMVIIEGAFLSIGSQNLTDGGMKSKEATVVCDPANIEKVLEATKDWRDRAERVSQEMVMHMDERVKTLGRKFRILQKHVRDEDVRLRKELEERHKEHLRKQKEEEIRRKKALREEEEKRRQLLA